MTMMNYLNRIALKENNKRREVLISILRELNCPYWTQCEKLEDVWVENIVVSFNKGLPKLVVGGHYDTVPNSTGANDNGSSVCILLEMIKIYMQNPPTTPLDIVFFDFEEIGSLGSEVYLRNTPLEDISAMINLDICGVGDTIVIAPAKNLIEGVLAEAINSVNKLETHKVEIIENLPPGDDRRFEEKRIPNISVCILEHSDVECMINMFINNEDKNLENFPSIIETMHNGSRDSIDVIEAKAMECVANWILDVVKHFKY